MPEVIFPHGIDYPDNKPITLSDIAATLIAHERLLPAVGEVLEAAIPGLIVENISISLDEINTGSLREAFFVAMLLVYQSDLDRETPQLFQAITGHTLDPSYKTIATVLFMTVLYTATSILLERIKKRPAAHDEALERELAAYQVLAADRLGVSPDVIKHAAERAVEKRAPTAIRAAIDLFRPAKRGGNGRIVPLGLPELSQAAIAAFPDAVALADMDANTVPIPVSEGRLVIRAMDRDRSDRGWHGKLVYGGTETRRLPIKLAFGIDPDVLGSNPEATVEALLEGQPQKDGDLKPIRIHVLRLTGPGSA